VAWGAVEDEGALGGSGGELCHGLTTSLALHDCWMCQWAEESYLEDSLFGLSFEIAPEHTDVKSEAVSRLQVEMVVLSYGRRFTREASSMYIFERKACILWIVNENRQLLFHFNAIDLKAFTDSPELWRGAGKQLLQNLENIDFSKFYK
jgi:hypothetical protein